MLSPNEGFAWKVLGIFAQAQPQALTPDKSGWYYAFYFLSPFIAPSITVGLGGWLIQRSFVSRANASAFADALVKRMDEVLVDSLEYWNIDSEEGDRGKRADVLAQKIKGTLKTLISDVNFFQRKYARGEEFQQRLMNIHDACTSGDFESASHKPDKLRYIFIVNQLNELKSQVLRIKI